MATPKTNLPPETEILSETRREVTGPPQTSPNQGLADPSQVVAETAPEEPLEQELETVDQPFTIDGGGEPLPEEPLGDEPTGIPLKDTQAALTKASQELAKMKKVLATVVANTQLTGQQPQQTPLTSPEMFSPEPTDDERLDPTKYTQRMMAVQEHKNKILEMQTFTENHPDWTDLMDTMGEISNEEEPGTFNKPGGLRRLHKRATEREELAGHRAAMKDGADKAFQAGANMQRKKGGSPFVSPGGSGGVKSRSTVPSDFAKWDTDKQLQWLKDHGRYKDQLV